MKRITLALRVIRAGGLRVDQHLSGRLANVVKLAGAPYNPQHIARALERFANIVGREAIVLTDFLCRHIPPVSLDHVDTFLKDVDRGNSGPLHRHYADIAKQYDLDSKDSPLQAMRMEDRAAFVRNLRDSDLDHWQVRQLLGIGCKSYEQLKSFRRQEGPRTGIDSMHRPWSRVKELFNAACVQLFVNSQFCSTYPPLILETCQGSGDASMIYRELGVVVAYERDDSDENDSPFSTARNRFQGIGCLRQFVPHSPGLIEDLEDEIRVPCPDGKYPVLMPFKPTEAIDGIDRLYRYHWQFDIIDIDPFGSSLSLLEKALDVTKDRALILLTLGDIYQGGRPTGYRQAFASLGSDLSAVHTDAEREVWRSNLWRALGAQAVIIAWKKGFHLIPFGAYLAAQPTKHIELEGQKTKVCGIDRLFFVARRSHPADRTLFTPHRVVAEDALIGCKILSTQLTDSCGRTITLPVLEFTDIWAKAGRNLTADTLLPDSIARELSKAFERSTAMLLV